MSGRLGRDPTKQYRVIRMSVTAPVTVELRVSRPLAEPDEEPDAWQIDSVDCVYSPSLTVASVNENMSEDDVDELERRANAVKDEE